MIIIRCRFLVKMQVLKQQKCTVKYNRNVSPIVLINAFVVFLVKENYYLYHMNIVQHQAFH